LTSARITEDWIHGRPDDRSGQSIPLFAGARVEFRGRRKATLETVVFDLAVLERIIVRLFSPVFVSDIAAMGAAGAIIVFFCHGFPLSRRLLRHAVRLQLFRRLSTLSHDHRASFAAF
jgi:hypothetical protein